jgi:hypothetical protein
MSSARLAAVALVVAAAGCVEEPLAPDIDHLRIHVFWANGRRDVAVSIPEIPCTGTKGGFLGEEGEQCETAPWTLTIDGVPFETTPMKCTAPYRGIFGPVDKSCSGGTAQAALPYVTAEDVEILAATGKRHTRTVLRGVRRSYPWTEEAPLQGASQPGLVRLPPGLELSGGGYDLSVMLAKGTAQGSARHSTADPGRLELSVAVSKDLNGVYPARVEAYMRQDELTIAVAVDGMLTIAQ